MASTQPASKRQRLAAEQAATGGPEPKAEADEPLEEKPAGATCRQPDKLSDRTDEEVGAAGADAEPDEDEGDDEGDDEDDDEDDEDDEDDDDDDDEDDEDDDDEDDDEENDDKVGRRPNTSDIQEQLAAAGPAGVAAAAAIASARKRKRPHSFETNPSVRKRQQTRLIRKLRACIDEYTMRVGQQAVVLITMPGKTAHNFKVFGAQPLESVIRACKQEIMGELEQALAEQAPLQLKEENSNKHELPALVIDGIPTPVEKMTQAQLRAFIPLMLKYSTGRGKPGWGKESTRPAWWPETLPWANVRSDAREESEKQRISWTTTLRQIVTNCYKFHGRDDLLPTFDDNEESLKAEREAAAAATSSANARRPPLAGRPATRATKEAQQQQQQANSYSYNAANHQFVHTIANGDGTVSLIQVDPANAQILTLPDGTQVRAVRLQTLGADSLCGQQITELQEASQLELLQAQQEGAAGESQTLTLQEAALGPDGQIIVTGEDGTQSCYPMSSLVSIPASVYQQLAGAAGQQLSVLSADGQTIQANAISLHQIQDEQAAASQDGQPAADQQQVVQLIDIKPIKAADGAAAATTDRTGADNEQQTSNGA